MKESFSLSYAISKIGKNILVNEIIDYSSNNGVYSVNNEVSALNDMPTPQDKDKANNSQSKPAFYKTCCHAPKRSAQPLRTLTI